MGETTTSSRGRILDQLVSLVLWFVEPLARLVPPQYVRQVPHSRLRAALLIISDRALHRWPRNFEIAGRYGVRLKGSTSDFINRFFYVFGVWEPTISDWLFRHLGPGDVFIDVGANVGWYSILAGRRVGPDGAVIAFEAVPSIATKLEANLALNGVPADVRREAVGAQPGRVEAFRSTAGNEGASGILPTETSGTEGFVPMVRLDDSIDSAFIDRIAAIKIDVEGSELGVLDGARELLSQVRPGCAVLIEVSAKRTTADTVQQIVEGLRGLNFRIDRIPNSYSPWSYVSLSSLEGLSLEPLVGLPTEQVDLVCRKC